MRFMSEEHVYRALNPRKMYEREDGSVSSAAFKDDKGLSVELQCFRDDIDVAYHMRNVTKLHGNIAKIGCSICISSNIDIVNVPSKNEFHRLLLNKSRKNDDNLCLTDIQADDLAENIIKLIP